MDQEKERKPFFIEFKSNYGTALSPTANSPTTLYCLHGKPQVQIRGHCHKQRTEGVDIKARKKLIIASILCLFFMVVEIVGGVLSNSLAIATDAAHLLTDFASFMISLFAIWIAGRPSTQRMSFGWYRAEVIGAVVSVVMIWVITAILIWLAVQRVITQDYELDATVMLITSALAIVVNLLMGFQLHHGHSHGGMTSDHTIPDNNIHITKNTPTIDNVETAHDDTCQNSSNNIHQNGHNSKTVSYNSGTGTIKTIPETTNDNQIVNKTSKILDIPPPPRENINVRAAFIHVLGDVLQSIGVFVAALVIYFKPEWAIADPICTFVFSIIVLFTTFSIMKDALLVLMEGTPSYLHYAEVMGIFLQIEGVERVHNLRIWALSINKIALSAHLAIRPGANANKILEDATSAVHLKYNFFETTLQIENFIPEMEECQQCEVPDS